MKKTLTEKILTTVLVTLALGIGIGIGYWSGSKKDTSNNFIKIKSNQIFSMNFNKNGIAGKHTDTISYPKAKILAEDFVAKLEGSIGIGGIKLIKWPAKLHGWVLDAQKVKDILIDKNGGTEICNNIFVELGYDNVDGTTTLIFTGLNTTGKDGKLADRRIYRKKDSVIWRSTIPNVGEENDNILEYVDPCNPRCPESDALKKL